MSSQSEETLTLSLSTKGQVVLDKVKLFISEQVEPREKASILAMLGCII